MATLTAVRIEGGLLSPDLLDLLLAGELPGQRPADFKLQARRGLTEEIAAVFADARALWGVFQHRLERLAETDIATTVTRDAWMIPFLGLLGYELRYNQRGYEVDGQTFAISHRAGEGEDAPVVHIVGARQELGRVPASGRPRLAPHALVQEYLNRTEQVWGLVTNGLTLRLLRNSTFVRRQAYVEFDLRAILEDQRFQDFSALYRLLHRSRLPDVGQEGECFLTRYYNHSVEQGGRVRDHLRDGVEECIRQLAAGFLNHPANEDLRRRVLAGSPRSAPTVMAGEGRPSTASLTAAELPHDRISPEDLYRQLLKLIYRLLFLLVAEDRGLLSPDPVYREHYGIARLRRQVDQRGAFNDYDDLWQSLRVLWRVLTKEDLAAILQLPPLNGELFALVELDNATIANHDLLRALWHLVYYQERGAPARRVNYAALDVEELGSVYESLLEFHPAIDPDPTGRPAFALLAGSERKTTGSYYTPPELVVELIKSAVEPVLAERLAAVPPERQQAALLAIKVCDPACGSGHFLLAAARRLGKELARLRTGADEPAPERVREAIRDVIGHCIYGVDKNPLAVDLCRVALWLESHVGERPLTFLDRRIRVGDSLVGVFDLKTLGRGIPDEAFKPLEGDDKETARMLARQNRHERAGQSDLLAWKPDEALAAFSQASAQIESISDDTPDAVRRKSALFRARYDDPEWVREKQACDLWTGAFFQKLVSGAPTITSDAVLRRLEGRPTLPQAMAVATDLAEENQFFHWPLEFPEVFAAGGFEVVLGNPPWERIKLQEQEFFSARDRTIATAPNAAVRGRMIAELAKTSPGAPEHSLHQAFVAAKRQAEAASVFARESGRFMLTSRGDINTYALFAEHAANLVNPRGRAGVIVPTGIATDATTAPFFGALIDGKRLARLIDFENRAGIFPAVDSRMKFSLLTIARGAEQARFAFFITDVAQLADPRRHFILTAADIARINPNTKTAPVFRARADAELTAEIYSRVPVLIEEAKGEEGNTWQVRLRTMFHKSNASREGILKPASELDDKISKTGQWLPVHEGEYGYQFDHRYGTFDAGDVRMTSETQHKNPDFEPEFELCAREVEYRNILQRWSASSNASLLGFRRVARSTDERTAIAAVLPRMPMTYGWIVVVGVSSREQALLCANFNSLIFDYCLRNSLSQPSIPQGTFQQLPTVPRLKYTAQDVAFVVSRVLELTYTSHSMAPFARELGFDGPPFTWNEGRRAQLRAELDAFYAHAYGLRRDELRYILDPEDVMGAGYPSETFRVLKTNETRRFGEYRTARLVLAAYDAIRAGMNSAPTSFGAVPGHEASNSALVSDLWEHITKAVETVGNDDGSVRVPDASLQFANALLLNLPTGLTLPQASVSQDGELVLTWYRKRDCLSATLEPDRHLTWVSRVGNRFLDGDVIAFGDPAGRQHFYDAVADFHK